MPAPGRHRRSDCLTARLVCMAPSLLHVAAVTLQRNRSPSGFRWPAPTRLPAGELVPLFFSALRPLAFLSLPLRAGIPPHVRRRGRARTTAKREQITAEVATTVAETQAILERCRSSARISIWRRLAQPVPVPASRQFRWTNRWFGAGRGREFRRVWTRSLRPLPQQLDRKLGD
jgi:hypothetical protein